MRRIALTCLATLGLFAAAVSAEGVFDCDRAYKKIWEKVHQESRSPGRHMALSRKALRTYDACRTNDAHDPKALFERLERWAE